MKPTFLILSGDGINCERETANAFEQASASAQIVHINELLDNPTILNNFSGMALPGGFSFGDELGSGQILALKIKHGLKNHFTNFVKNKKPIIGICNGFQVLTKLGILPFPGEDRAISLATNNSGKFINSWADLIVGKNTVCKWLCDIEETFALPVRHGEGRIVFKQNFEQSTFNRLQTNGQIALYYKNDLNGSYANIAGICDPSGLIFGLMPHPEAYIFEATSKTHNKNPLQNAVGLNVFKSIVKYLSQN